MSSAGRGSVSRSTPAGSSRRTRRRYAEILPEGPARVRAGATARSVASMTGPLDADHDARAFAPDVQGVDHQMLGTWSAPERNGEALVRLDELTAEPSDPPRMVGQTGAVDGGTIAP
jgi:hypothetical protein